MVSRWLRSGNRTFLEAASMVVTLCIVASLAQCRVLGIDSFLICFNQTCGGGGFEHALFKSQTCVPKCYCVYKPTHVISSIVNASNKTFMTLIRRLIHHDSKAHHPLTDVPTKTRYQQYAIGLAQWLQRSQGVLEGLPENVVVFSIAISPILHMLYNAICLYKVMRACYWVINS